MKNKRLLSIILVAVTIAMSMSLFAGCGEKASDYTEKEHIARVTQLARKRYIDNGDFTDLEVFPLYDENDKLGYFLIELQPTGFNYVKLNYSARWDTYFGMYTRALCEMNPWARITVEEGNQETYYFEDTDVVWTVDNAKWSELDENNKPIMHKESHFKASNISDEKRYLLQVQQGTEKAYIPAVKRGDKYLNLVSLEEFVYESKTDRVKFATARVDFCKAHFYDL